MHQLLWNAADVDAGAAQAPAGSDRRRLNEVAKADLLAEEGGLFGSCEAARAASDDLQKIKFI